MAIGRRTLIVSAVALLAACTDMLPKGRTDIASRFDSFESARAAIDKVLPYRTSIDDLREIGFDVQAAANVKQIPYPEVVSRLAPNPSVPLNQLDPGIRDCIEARQACRAYEFTLGQQERRREGGFFRDFLNFDRTTHTTGWRFSGLIVVRDQLVVFKNYGGEPQIDHSERQRNPLGPLQPGGEALGNVITR